MLNIHAITAHVLPVADVRRMVAVECGIMPDSNNTERALQVLIRDGYVRRIENGFQLTIAGKLVVAAYRKAGWIS